MAEQTTIQTPKGDVAVPKVATAQIAEALTKRILDGEIPAGGRLKESLLAQEFGVSRNTVRGALTLLEYQGLTAYTPNRGWVVWRPTEEDLLDVYLTRYYMETAAARSVSPGTSFVRVKDALDALLEALTDGDEREILERDLTFHAEIVALLGSTRINEYYERLSQEIKYTFFIISMAEHFGEPGELRSTHLDIYFALTSGDPERASRVLGDSILATREDLLRSLAK
ncbi:GntR family transcriptional regulator [Leucobacter sp. W1038]|uniref:GntR family transcriptional regulator n=1 Tax=Leucobacter sp. W1038 TaxID=3438281 RepID=UPI003D9584C7